MKAVTLAVAALLLVQVAFAIDLKKKQPAPTPAFVAPVMQVQPKVVKVKTPIEYCFQAKIQKPSTSVVCPTGYTLDNTLHKCLKTTGYSCKVGNLTQDSSGKNVCQFCKPLYKVVDGQCVLGCLKGFAPVMINGQSQCVEGCPAGFGSQGNDCISQKKHYVPKQCNTKLCLPGFQLFFAANSSYSAASSTPAAATPAGRKLAHAPILVTPNCVCAFTYSRKVFQQSIEQPQAIPALPKIMVAEPICENGAKPFLGNCPLPCPNTCQEVSGQCVYGCPAGYVQCKDILLKTFCVKTDSYNPNVCKEALTVLLPDQSQVCPIPSSIPTVVIVNSTATATSG